MGVPGATINIGGGGGGGDGGGDDGGSSSSGSSSSSSSSSGPTYDPVTQQKISMFASIYAQIWGEPATEAYLAGAAKAGLNSTEFAWRERHKPEFVKSDAFRNKASSLAGMLHDLGVA